MSPPRTTLKQSDSAVLRHIRRYRVGIPEYLERDLPQHPVDLALGRLVRRNCIRQERHSSGLTYFRIADDRLLSDVALIRVIGILDFCCGRKPKRPLIDREELKDYFPTLYRSGLPSGHYLTSVHGQPRLGHIRVDAVPARIDRILSRTCRIIDRYRNQRGFQKLITQRQFEITHVVATPQKATRLRPVLEALSTSGVTLRVHAVLELVELISPIETPVGSSTSERRQHDAMAARPNHHSRP